MLCILLSWRVLRSLALRMVGRKNKASITGIQEFKGLGSARHILTGFLQHAEHIFFSPTGASCVVNNISCKTS